MESEITGQPRPQARRQAYVIGAGVAGLTAALRLQEAGWAVTVLEAGPRPGGRCGGWADTAAGVRRDRGTHLILSGNRALTDLIRRCGAEEQWIQLPARYEFFDASTANRWTVAPGPMVWPGWLLSRHRRVQGVSAFAHLSGLLTLETSRAETVGQAVDLTAPLGRLLIAPLARAILNTDPAQASLPLLRTTLRKTLYRGAGAVAPWLCRTSLEEDLIIPLCRSLVAGGGTLRVRSAASGLVLTADGRSIAAIQTAEGILPCDGAVVIAAVPPRQAERLLPGLLPGLRADLPSSPIANAHFPISDSQDKSITLTGLCSGVGDWILRRSGHIAVTISAAPDIPDPVACQAALWQEVRRLYPDLPEGVPAGSRLLVERHATLLQTPEVDRRRPAARLDHWPEGLALAGDWVQTGLPCTLEGAVHSGGQAVSAAVRSLRCQ